MITFLLWQRKTRFMNHMVTGRVGLRALMNTGSPSLPSCQFSQTCQSMRNPRIWLSRGSVGLQGRVTRQALPWEQGSAERADMDLRMSFARYLNSREQGITKPLTPLIDRWVALTSHPMTLRVIRYGHEIPFNVMGPPPFNGVLNSIPTDPAETQVLRQELEEMVAKGAVTRVPDYLAHEGYNSRYFLVPKGDGGR